MTNSTDNKKADGADSSKAVKSKKPKKAGPIRTEAVVPVLIIGVLFGLYFKFFFDLHLRKSIEFGGTMIHGAEVNVGVLNTSVMGGYLHIEDIQVTDKNNPANNLVAIGKIHFGLVWDALLRAKLVVEEATIENIQIQSPRIKPGHIVPASEREFKALADVESAALEQTKSTFKENVLGDLADVVGGADPSSQLDGIKAKLKSEARLSELEKELKQKEVEWQARLKALPSNKEMKSWEAQGKALKFNTNNPAQFAKDLEVAKGLIKQVDGQIKSIDKTGKDLNGNITGFQVAFKELDAMVKKDVADLQNRFKIPSLNVGDFSKNLFGRLLSEKLGGMQKYVLMAKEYMPAKAADAEKKPAVVTPKRSKGKNYQFKVTTGYPLFWLKKAKISSEPGLSEYSGRLAGEITDVTSHPKALGRPALMKLKGDFPKQKIFGLDLNIKVEHSIETPYEEFDLNIKKYPLGVQKLSDSKAVKLIVRKAQGSVNVKGRVAKGIAQIELRNRWSEIDYQVDASGALVKEILTGVVADVPAVLINARARGAWDQLKWNINSNLGSAIARGFEAQVAKKIAQAKAKLNAFVNEKIKAKKAALQSQLDQAKARILGPINAKKAEVERVKTSANQQMNSKKKAAKKGGQKKLEKAGKKLLKGLGF